MKRVALFIIAVCLFAPFAQAQHFNPNLKGSDGAKLPIALFANPNYNSLFKGLSIQPEETLRVDSLLDNGWCKVFYHSPVTGKDYDGYYALMRILTPVAGDLQATALKAQFENRVAWETRTVKWSIILIGIGLLLTFMGFLGKIRTILLVLVVLAASAIEVHFLLGTNGFTFYSPAVMGWGTAAKWFGCFALFFVVQIYVFFKTLWSIDFGGLKALAWSTFLIWLVASAYLLAFIPAIFEYEGILKWVDNNALWFFLAGQVAIVISVFFFCPLKEAIIFAPVYAIGFAAIGLMAIDLIIVAILAAAALAVMPAMMQAGTTYQEGKTDPITGRTKYKWVDGVNPLDIFKK